MANAAVTDLVRRSAVPAESRPCRACGHELPGVALDAYAVCGTCGSANYVSRLSAEEDNARYFDEVYSDDTRRPVDTRFLQFARFEKFHSALHANEWRVFHLLLDQMSKRIIAAGKCVEVGFGSGDELARYLTAGANLYGVDASHEAVSKFRMTYPQFSDRVAVGTTVTSAVDVVYCNALFEHLDDPAAFLDATGDCLSPDGHLLLRLPVITREVDTGDELCWDINVWKPCHRVLYTYRGLQTLLAAHGFSIVQSKSLAYYGFKVMSTMLRRGFTDVARVRNPYFAIRGLESDSRYLMILVESLFRTLTCSDTAVVARKIQ